VSQKTSNILQAGKKGGHNSLTMKILRIILPIIATVLVACSNDTNCLIADSIHPIKMINVDGSEYSIYLKISGFHDKVSFYELYKGKPIFDECGWPNTLAIAEEPVDPSLGAVSKLVIDARRLHIVYTENKFQKVDLKNVPVEIKSLTNKSSGR
jgi:hypothetical protein